MQISSATNATIHSIYQANQLLEKAQSAEIDQAKKMIKVNMELALGPSPDGKGQTIDVVV